MVECYGSPTRLREEVQITKPGVKTFFINGNYKYWWLLEPVPGRLIRS